MDHFVLATTAGGSMMRGPEVGEFDHLTWVTMKKDGPTVALLNMDGIYDKNLVPAVDYADIEILRRGNWLDVQPVVNETDSFQTIKINLHFKNDMKRPMTITGKLPPVDGLSFEPDSVKTKVAPGQEQTL